MVKKCIINSEYKDFTKVFFSLEVLLTGLIIPTIVIIVNFFAGKTFVGFDKITETIYEFFYYIINNGLILLFTYALSIILVSIPIFTFSQIKINREIIEKNLCKIDNLSYFSAFHTENNSLKRRLDSISELEPSQQWILSKYISKLLSESIGSFSINLSAVEYSQFSSLLFLECKGSIDLTGSLRPATWLNLLVDETNSQNRYDRKQFFNNILDYTKFPINEDNHSITLINQCSHISIDNKFRVVCLSQYDINFLYISERSIDTYYHINNPEKLPKSFFKEYNPYFYKIMNPMEYEYALYDKPLLLKYKKEENKKGILKLINKNDIIEVEDRIDFYEVLDFFKKSRTQPLLDYKKIKEKVNKEKISLLSKIIENKVLPHKLSYLYSGGIRWVRFLEKGNTKYCDSATLAIQDGLIKFKNSLNNGAISIIEIGAGAGDRISTICDTLGSNNISSYHLLDISDYLLNKANEVLKERMPKLRGSNNKILLDCCDSLNKEKFENEIKDKYVFIPNNSTLFTEEGFMLESLKKAKGVFITLDMYDKKDDKKTFNDHLEAKELFLFPLRIFEIPIDGPTLNDENNKDIFFHNKYENNKFKITFNIKAYTDKLKENLRKQDVFGNIKKIDNSESFNTYNNLRKKLISITDLTVLSSLKFSEEKDIKTYFNDFNDFNIDIHTFERGKDKFASILLTRDKKNGN